MAPDANIQVRSAVKHDLPAVNDIYNHYVQTSHCTFDLEPWALEKRITWFNELAPPWMLVVAAQEDKIFGFAYSSRFRPRSAYNRSVETTVYLNHEFQPAGTGSLLMRYLLNLLSKQEVHRAYAGVAQPNAASVHLHEKLGYQYIGTYNEVGFKFGRYHDVSWYEYALANSE